MHSDDITFVFKIPTLVGTKLIHLYIWCSTVVRIFNILLHLPVVFGLVLLKPMVAEPKANFMLIPAKVYFQATVLTPPAIYITLMLIPTVSKLHQISVLMKDSTISPNPNIHPTTLLLLTPKMVSPFPWKIITHHPMI